jgi:hypothetical protein
MRICYGPVLLRRKAGVDADREKPRSIKRQMCIVIGKDVKVSGTKIAVLSTATEQFLMYANVMEEHKGADGAAVQPALFLVIPVLRGEPTIDFATITDKSVFGLLTDLFARPPISRGMGLRSISVESSRAAPQRFETADAKAALVPAWERYESFRHELRKYGLAMGRNTHTSIVRYYAETVPALLQADAVEFHALLVQPTTSALAGLVVRKRNTGIVHVPMLDVHEENDRPHLDPNAEYDHHVVVCASTHLPTGGVHSVPVGGQAPQHAPAFGALSPDNLPISPHTRGILAKFFEKLLQTASFDPKSTPWSESFEDVVWNGYRIQREYLNGDLFGETPVGADIRFQGGHREETAPTEGSIDHHRASPRVAPEAPCVLGSLGGVFGGRRARGPPTCKLSDAFHCDQAKIEGGYRAYYPRLASCDEALKVYTEEHEQDENSSSSSFSSNEI